jgi:hypothetical protein
MRILLILILLAIPAIPSKIPSDAKQAHKEADAILHPLLVAAMNDFSLHHGGIDDPGHLDKIDAQDKVRIQAFRDAFHKWDDAMKKAGY